MFDILEIFDKDFITNSIIISIAGVFLLFFIFRCFLKLSSNLKVLFIAMVVYIFTYTTIVTVLYLSDNNYLFSNQTKYYISGTVQAVEEENNVIRIFSNNSTLESGGKGIINARYTKSTVFCIISNGEEIKVKPSDIKAGARVEIMCKESKETDKRVTAVKVTKKYY